MKPFPSTHAKYNVQAVNHFSIIYNNYYKIAVNGLTSAVHACLALSVTCCEMLWASQQVLLSRALHSQSAAWEPQEANWQTRQLQAVHANSADKTQHIKYQEVTQWLACLTEVKKVPGLNPHCRKFVFFTKTTTIRSFGHRLHIYLLSLPPTMRQ